MRRRLKRLLFGPPPPVARPDPRPTAALADYPHRHPELLTLRPEMLAPGFIDVVDGAEPERVHADVFAFPVFTDAVLAALVDELDALEAWARAHRVELERPNSMNRYGVVLDDVGFGRMLAELRQDWLGPVAARLFPQVGGALDDHHAFVVDYRRGGDVDLGFHVDDSEVTLNLCLAPGFEGGDLFFHGRRCGAHRQGASRAEERIEYAHQAGMAILHAGKHRHGAWPITQGHRRNLIVWLQARAWRREHDDGQCAPWCGEYGEMP